MIDNIRNDSWSMISQIYREASGTSTKMLVDKHGIQRSSPVGDDSVLGQPKELIRTSKSDRMKKSTVLRNVAYLSKKKHRVFVQNTPHSFNYIIADKINEHVYHQSVGVSS